MYYLQSRYYHAKLGRFVNEDTTETICSENSTSNVNLFSYCKNNPVNNLDISGNVVFTTIVKLIMGALFGLLVQLVSDLIEYTVNKYVFKVEVSEEFVPSSPVGDYLGSAVAWAFNTLTPYSKASKIIYPLVPVAVKHITNLLFNKFKLRDFLIDFGYAILVGIISIALTNATSRKLERLKKHKKKNSKNLVLKATKKQLKYKLNLNITKVAVTFTALDAVTILILNILLPQKK